MYCKNATDRQDVFQEILAQLWKSFPSFRNESKVSTWIYRVALNTAISFYRKERKVPEKELIQNSLLLSEEIHFEEEQRAQIAFLYKAINKLTKVEKAIILLYLEEKSYEEISDIMGITITNVGVKINRIKSKLKKILNPVSDEFR